MDYQAAISRPAAGVQSVYTPESTLGAAWLLRAPFELLASVARNRELVMELGMCDLKARNQGAVLGWAWIVIRPFVQTLAYVAVVSVLAGAAGRGNDGALQYALYVLSGLIPWQILTSSLESAPSLIRDRTELVKQVVFPIETLPLTGFITGTCGAMVSLVTYLALLAGTGSLKWSVLLVPIPLVLVAVLSVGLAWFAMILGVVLKDLREIVALGLALAVYLTPVIIREETASPRIWQIVLCNPLSHVVICFRDVYQGSWHPVSWAIFAGLALCAVLIGAATVALARRHINEYI
jgi:lipopolysaccharide transport system permease protein